jgi:hypothetical protein
MSLTVAQEQQINRLFFDLIAALGNITVTASISAPVVSATSQYLVTSSAGTLADLYTQYGVWIAANPTKKIISQTAILGQDGHAGILILFE